MVDDLRMRATLVDQVTPTAKKITNELSQIGKIKPGTELTKDLDKVQRVMTPLRATILSLVGQMRGLPATMRFASGGFASLGSSMEGAGTAATGLVGRLGSVGTAIAAAGAAIAGSVMEMRRFAKESLSLDDVARRSGTTVEEVVKLQRAMKGFGIDSQTTQRSITHFTDQMTELKYNFGSLRDELIKGRAGGLARELKGLADAGRMDEARLRLHEYIEQLQAVGKHAEAAKLSELAFGDAVFDRVKKARQAVREQPEPTARDIEEIKKVEKEYSKIEDRLDDIRIKADNLNTSLNSGALKALRELLAAPPGGGPGGGGIGPGSLIDLKRKEIEETEKRLQGAGSGREREQIQKQLDRQKGELLQLEEYERRQSKERGEKHGALIAPPFYEGIGTGLKEHAREHGLTVGRMLGETITGSDGRTTVAGGIGGDALGGSPVIGGPRGGPGGGIRPPGQGRRGILEGPAVKGAAPGYTATRNEVEDYIRQAAIARGIDPETALKVYRSEGAGAWQSLSRKGGMREPSYGPFQLLKGGPGTGFPMGLGNKAPFDVTDPGTWRQNIDFALNQAVQGGWGPWMGARKQGITGRMGIGPGATPQGITPATPSAPGSGGISGGAPLAGATGPSARHMQGSITMEGQTYRYGSGGAGRGATPPGSYPVNIGRGDIGPIGQRIGSIATVGGLGGTIRDPRFPGSPRLGIQIHASTGARLDQLYSQGCFAVDRRQWPAFRQHLLDLNSRTPGGLRIDVDQDGRAQIVARNQQIVSGGVPTSNFAGGGATGFGTGGAPYSLRSPESAAITRALQTQVNPALTATGQLDVNVRAPRGTVVKASGTGLFTDVHTQRQVQNEESAYGRAESLEVD